MNDYKNDIPERTFMRMLLKHTGIALVIIVPIAVFTSVTQAATGSTFSKMDSTAKVDSTSKVDGTLQVNSTTYDVSDNHYDESHAYNGLVQSRPNSIDHFDITRYAGTWYEIARLPMRFQKECHSNVTATYNLNKDSAGNLESVDVINQCLRVDGTKVVAKGLATQENSVGSELKVTFLPSWLRWLPFGKADYWVLELDEDYKSALVGTPDNKYLWILSRSPNIDDSTLSKYKSIAANQGYDISKLKLTTQNYDQNL